MSSSRPSPRHPFLEHAGVLALAHRGGAAGCPENTVAAFERAVGLGYRYLETDARATADGVVLAFHDARLERMTDAAGALAELPWRVVRTARVAGGEPIPTIEDLLDRFPTTRFNIDVKAGPAVRPLVDAVRRARAWDRVCVASFSDARLAAARAAGGPRLATSTGPRAVLGLRLRSLAGPPLDRWPGGAGRGACCVQVPARVPAAAVAERPVRRTGRPSRRGVPLVDRRFVRTVHRLGLQVHVWTIDDAAQMHAMLDLGVDGIVSDRVELLREVLIERGVWARAPVPGAGSA